MRFNWKPYAVLVMLAPTVLARNDTSLATHPKSDARTATGNTNRDVASAKDPAAPVPQTTYLNNCAGTNDTALISAAISLGNPLVIPVGVTCATNNLTISVPLSVAYSGRLKPNTGQTATLTSGFWAGGDTPWQAFSNALSGQGTISFAGNRSLKSFSLEWWGGVADGATENRAFVYAMFAAIKTAGGGRWLLPAGANYFYSPAGSYGNSTETFSQEASNIVIEGSGWSSVITTGGNFGARFGMPYAQPPFTPGTFPWTTPANARFNDAVVGGQSVTLTTPADSSLFAVGNTVFLLSGDAAPGTGHSPYSFEYNEISAINATTGVVTLKYGLRDTYDSLDTGYEPRIVRLNSAPQNITLRNLKITRASGSIATLLDFSGTRDVHVENCSLEGLLYTTFTDGVWMSGNLIGVSDSSFPSSFDGGDAAQNHHIENNTIRYQGGYGIIYSGSLKDIYIKGNHISGFAKNSSSGQAIVVGGRLRTRLARGVKILNNTIILDTGTSTGINVSNAINPLISGNEVRGNLTTIGGSGITLSETVTGWRVSDNIVEITGSNAGAFQLIANGASDVISRGAAVNNVFHAPAFGIFFSNGGLGTILKNRFVANDLGGNTLFRFFSNDDNTLDGWATADMRGTATIADAATTFAVTFTTVLDNTNYRVNVTPTTSTGGPAAGSNRIASVSKTTTGFTVTVETAPTVGKSQSFDWLITF